MKLVIQIPHTIIIRVRKRPTTCACVCCVRVRARVVRALCVPCAALCYAIARSHAYSTPTPTRVLVCSGDAFSNLRQNTPVLVLWYIVGEKKENETTV